MLENGKCYEKKGQRNRGHMNARAEEEAGQMAVRGTPLIEMSETKI